MSTIYPTNIDNGAYEAGFMLLFLLFKSDNGSL